MADIFLTNAWTLIENRWEEHIMVHVARFTDNSCEDAEKHNRMLAIDKWVKTEKIKAFIFAKTYETTRDQAEGQSDEERGYDYMYFYSFENEDDAVECVLRFGNGSEFHWPNEEFVRFVD